MPPIAALHQPGKNMRRALNVRTSMYDWMNLGRQSLPIYTGRLAGEAILARFSGQSGPPRVDLH
jgi:hypothetical protein